MSHNERRFERLLPAQIKSEMKRCPLIYVPLGPIEWHGPHLPMGTDPMVAHGVALQVASETGGVVLPPLFCGSERERTPEQLRSLGFQGDEWIVGMDFPKNALRSLYFREEFMALHVRETLDLLIRQGYRLIVIMNGHGAANHQNVLGRLSAEITETSPARVLVFTAWACGEECASDSGHASGAETSQMMALFPDLVDLSQLPPLPAPLYNLEWAVVDGPTFEGHPSPDFTNRDDPRREASPERGEAMLAVSVKYIVEQVSSVLKEMDFPAAD